VLLVALTLAVIADLALGADTLPPLEEGGVPQNLDELWAGYDPAQEPLEVEVVREWQRGDATVRMLVYTGTETILAPRRHHGPIREETQSALRDMIGPYCRSKFLAQQAVLQAARSGLPALVVVPTLPIGPGDRNLTPPGRMISDFLQGKIPGYIDCTLNFVDVRDAALGHVFAAENGEPGRRYILSGHNLTLAEFFCYLSRESSRPPPRHRVPYVVALAWSCVEEWMGKLTGRTPQSSVTGVRLCRRSLAFDGTRTWQLLGHSPRPVEESIRDAVLWHQRRLSPATGTR
jgi:dihydroflavonol-4-reductase